MSNTPGPLRIILHCIAIGAKSGAVSGASFALLWMLAASGIAFSYGQRFLEWPAFLLAVTWGFGIGLVLGLLFGLANGLALATLLRIQSIRLEAQRLACGLTSIVTSIVCIVWIEVICRSPDGFFLSWLKWWNVVILGIVLALSWWASGRFYCWYVSDSPPEPPAA